MKWTQFVAAHDGGFGGPRRFHGPIRMQLRKDVENRLQTLCAFQHGGHHLDRGHLAAADLAGKPRRGGEAEIAVSHRKRSRSRDRAAGNLATLIEIEAFLTHGVHHVVHPGDTAGVGAAEYDEQQAGFLADIAKAAMNSRWHRNHVPLVQHQLVLALAAPDDRPAALQRHEYFHGGVVVQARAFLRLRLDNRHVEAVNVADWDVHARLFGDAATDDVENLPMELRQYCIHQGHRTRLKLVEKGGALEHLLAGNGFAVHGVSFRWSGSM